jgi:uncharacterized protein (DUF58 family)
MINIRPAISAPLPWLTMFAVKVFGRASAAPKKGGRYYLVLPRTLKFTREGTRFVIMVLLVGMAAINTGNNLLYLVVAMLLSLIIISGIMSESTLRGLNVKRQLPRHIFRGVPAPVMLRIENKKRILTSYSFNVREKPCPGLKVEPAYILKLDGSKNTIRVSRYTFLGRGLFKLEGLEFTTRFPFGLFLKGRKDGAADEVVVYPRIRPIKEDDAFQGFSFGTNSMPKRGAGTQLHGLRDYTLSDDSRFIHWRSAARTLKLQTKEFEKEREQKYLILFENYLDKGKENGAEHFEQVVEEAASLAGHFIDKGFSVGLKTLTKEVPVRAGKDHLYRILRTLALTGPQGPSGAPSVRVLSL